MQPDLYSSYAVKAAPRAVPGKPRADKAPSALDKKMAEKQRLSKAYRVSQRERTKALLAAEPRLVRFLKYLRTIRAGDGEELLEAVAESWLPEASQEVRLFALRMIDARCNAINRKLGFPELDDPVPPETSVYFRARDILRSRKAAA